MSSVLKPSLTASVPQNSSVPSQLNKPMHPQQGPPQSYGQPPNHHSMMPHGNPAVAHNHPSSHQANHYSLNVPNASSHYMGNNQPIPASNHPAPNNPSQPSAGQQIYGGAKNMAYQGGYQPNLGHPPNQSANQLPPISQTLPATNSQSNPHHTEEERSQSNGTSDEKSNCTQENHVTVPKETSTVPATQTAPQDKTEKSGESKKTVESDKSVANVANAASDIPGNIPKSPSSQTTTTAVSKPSENIDNVASPPKDKEVTQTESSLQSEKKIDDAENSSIKDVKNSCSEEKGSENKKLAPLSVANENETSASEEKEKPASDCKDLEKPTTSKARTVSRKVSKITKHEEDSPKVQRIEPKPSSSQKSPSSNKTKRARTRTQPYQSPLPELEIISKISASSSQRNKTNDDKLTVFFKNEFLAVRNSEGSFYVCQAVQNIYRSSTKIRIRWLSQDKNDKNNQIYTPDFYDHTDFDCILTNINLERVEKGKFRLPPAEKDRTDSILKRSLAAEKGEEVSSPNVTEEHPDGLDLSLYKDENQLNKRKGKKRSATSPMKSSRRSSRSPAKKTPETPKVSKTNPESVKKVVLKRDTPARKTQTPTPTPRKTSGSRTERAKRRSDNINAMKVSPVSPKMDQKKAKALAKVARKSVVTPPKAPTPVKKETKTSKPNPLTTVKAKTTLKAATTSSKRKVTKRSSRK